jgi:hypothetical protein
MRSLIFILTALININAAMNQQQGISANLTLPVKITGTNGADLINSTGTDRINLDDISLHWIIKGKASAAVMNSGVRLDNPNRSYYFSNIGQDKKCLVILLNPYAEGPEHVSATLLTIKNRGSFLIRTRLNHMAMSNDIYVNDVLQTDRGPHNVFVTLKLK